MRMFSSWKCLDALLLLIILNTSISLPPTEKPKCEILLSLYPPDIDVKEVLHNCKNTELQEPILSYCVELVGVLNDVNSCGLGQLLHHVNNSTYKDIVSKSLAVSSIKEPICEVFQKLNASLYRLYLNKPGFGRQLSSGIFCRMFCEKSNKCEILLRTYWIKKILLEASQAKDKLENAGTSGKVTPVNAVKPGNGAGGNGDLQNKNQPTTAVLHQETKHVPNLPKQVTSKSGSLADIATTKQLINGGEPNKPKLEVEHTITSNIAVEKVKSPEIHITIPVLANTDLHHNNGIGTTPKESDKDATATNKLKLNNSPVVNKPANHDDNGNTVEPKAKVKDDNNDGSEIKSQLAAVTAQKQNANTDENIIINGHIPLDPDRTIDDDVATTMEKGKFGNQIHDFADGYGEQTNEYQDNSQDGPEVPLAVETVQPVQPDLKDNIADNNLQSDEASIRKQTNNVPVFPEEEDSHFFAYFLTIVVVCIAGYLVFHNKQKIIALIIEGRHERRRRPNNGTYKRLDSKDNTKATSHIIF